MAKKTPSPLKIVRGGDPRNINTKAPKPKSGAPDLPRGMMTKEAQRIWHKLTPTLAEMGVLTEIDAFTLALLCQHWAYALEAIRTIDAQGLFRDDENGVTRKHPAHQILRDSTAMIMKIGSEFGLTPSARESLHVEMVQEDPYESFLAKRTGAR